MFLFTVSLLAIPILCFNKLELSWVKKLSAHHRCPPGLSANWQHPLQMRQGVNRADKPLDRRSLQWSVTGQYGRPVHSGAILRRWFVAEGDSVTSDTSCLSSSILLWRGRSSRCYSSRTTNVFHSSICHSTLVSITLELKRYRLTKLQVWCFISGWASHVSPNC